MDDRGCPAGGWRLHGPLMYRRTDAPTYRRTDVLAPRTPPVQTPGRGTRPTNQRTPML